MRAKTLWQPHASLVACGAKTSETRSQPPPRTLVGARFAIQAAKRPVDWFDDVQPIIDHSPEAREAINAALKFGRDAALRCDTGSTDWPLGAVVATARLVDAFKVDTFVRVEKSGDTEFWKGGIGIAEGHQPRQVRMDGLGDYGFGRWVWLLDNIEALDEPIPARGRQGIWYWEPPDGVAARRIRDRAVLLLTEEGWCKDQFRGPNGERSLLVAVDDAANYFDLDESEAYDDVLLALLIAVGDDKACHLHYESVAAWADDSQRTLGDVLEMLGALELA